MKTKIEVGLELLEKYLDAAATLGKQDGKWWLFADGEGLVGGGTFEDLVSNILKQGGKPHEINHNNRNGSEGVRGLRGRSS